MSEDGEGPDRTWFDVTTAVADRLVPAVAEWAVMHVRTSVLELVRSGWTGPLQDRPGAAAAGEALTTVVLRHRDPDLEVALRGVVEKLRPAVGDPYGSGRVTGTGQSRLAPRVDPAHLRAIATDEANLALLQRLDLGSAVVVPVPAGGVVIGALNLVWSVEGEAGAERLALAESYGRRIGSALEGSLPATARLPRERLDPVARPTSLAWSPPEAGNPVADARAWARRSLPELLHDGTRSDLAEDLDLVVSELVGNALRHSGTVGGMSLVARDGSIRVAVRDHDERAPVVRRPQEDRESGRGLLIVEALSRTWSVDHDLEAGGKQVWAELAVG